MLTVNELGRVGEVAAIARRTRRIALQSVLAGMGMSLAAMGVAEPACCPRCGERCCTRPSTWPSSSTRCARRARPLPLSV